jgi:hypothetical protein
MEEGTRGIGDGSFVQDLDLDICLYLTSDNDDYQTIDLSGRPCAEPFAFMMKGF